MNTLFKNQEIIAAQLAQLMDLLDNLRTQQTASIDELEAHQVQLQAKKTQLTSHQYKQLQNQYKTLLSQLSKIATLQVQAIIRLGDLGSQERKLAAQIQRKILTSEAAIIDQLAKIQENIRVQTAKVKSKILQIKSRQATFNDLLKSQKFLLTNWVEQRKQSLMVQSKQENKFQSIMKRIFPRFYRRETIQTQEEQHLIENKRLCYVRLYQKDPTERQLMQKQQ